MSTSARAPAAALGAAPRPATGAWLLAIALVSLAAVGAALVAQHVFDMQPCPWCILQRLIYLAIAAVCLLGALLRVRPARALAAILALLLSISGIASAVFQHQVASRLNACNLTLADTIITSLKLESAVPWLFQVTASCADAAVSLLGVPFEYWSLALYVLIAVASVLVITASVQR